MTQRRIRRDLAGLAAIVAGLIVAGSVWIAATGAFGEALNWTLSATVGLVRLALPVVLVTAGVFALVDARRLGIALPAGSPAQVEVMPAKATKKAPLAKRSKSKSAKRQAPRHTKAPGGGATSPAAPQSPKGRRFGRVMQRDSTRRSVIGGALMVTAAAGLLHLGSGRPGIGDSVDVLGDAGGLLGVAVGGSLHALSDIWGSSLILLFAGVAGAMIATQVTVVTLARAVVAMLRPVWRGLRFGTRSLFSDLKEAQEPTPSAAASTGGSDAARPQLPQHVNPQATEPAGPSPNPPPWVSGGDPNGSEVAGSASQRSQQRQAPSGPEPSKTSGHVAASHFVPHSAPAAAATSTAKVKPGKPGGAKAKPPTKGTGQKGKAAAAKKAKHKSRWVLPPADLLVGDAVHEIDQAEADERGRLLQATLARFGVPTRLLEPVVGPTVTRYVLELGEGIKVAKLESLRKDIAYAMASPDVRILAPIPGRRAIGVEVPNLDRQVVRLGDVLRSREASHAEHPLEVAVGRDINGNSIMMNLATTPHLLIAGATGAGKSSCLNSIITSVLMRSDPDEVRMILIDPKRVEMGQYDRVPHLLTAPVTEPRKAANALAWAVTEMERRYDLLSKVGFRDVGGYNAAVEANAIEALPGERGPDGRPLQYKRLPFVLVVVDELADLMMVAARNVEESIARIAQMARAVGIHLVIATQRPSVNIITGVIKANVPARMAFAVSSLTDSRVILDQPGAERLVGQGDLLFLSPSSSTPHRIQGCWVTEDEVRAVVGHWRAQEPQFRDDPAVSTGKKQGRAGPPSRSAPVIQPTLPGTSSPAAPDVGGEPIIPSTITAAPPNLAGAGASDDELLEAAMSLVIETQLGSTSMLQRRLRVGFARAGRLMDLLEQRGVVGPSVGSKARKVLVPRPSEAPPNSPSVTATAD